MSLYITVSKLSFIPYDALDWIRFAVLICACATPAPSIRTKHPYTSIYSRTVDPHQPSTPFHQTNSQAAIPQNPIPTLPFPSLNSLTLNPLASSPFLSPNELIANSVKVCPPVPSCLASTSTTHISPPPPGFLPRTCSKGKKSFSRPSTPCTARIKTGGGPFLV